MYKIGIIYIFKHWSGEFAISVYLVLFLFDLFFFLVQFQNFKFLENNQFCDVTKFIGISYCIFHLK